MEKSELMKRYEEEKKKDANDELYSGSVSLYLPTVDYIEWLESKASAYDRLMSGGKKTLKEWANIFGMPFALGRYSQGIAFKCKSLPVVAGNNWWPTDVGDFGFAFIDRSLIDFKGDWTTSLTLPDGWEEK